MIEILSSSADDVAAFIITYLIHSTSWILLVFMIRHICVAGCSDARVLLWRSAIAVPVVTSVAVSLPGVPHCGVSVHIGDITGGILQDEFATELAAGSASQTAPGIGRDLSVSEARPMMPATLTDGGHTEDGRHAAGSAATSPAFTTHGLSAHGRTEDFERTRSPSGLLTASQVRVVFVLTCLGICICSCLRIGIPFRRLRALRRRCVQMNDESVTAVVKDLALQAGISRRVDVAQTTELQGPLAAGIVRPFILLPYGFAGQLSPEDRRAMFAHELAHISRNDALWNLIGHAVCHVFFIQPLNFVVRQQMRIDAEFVADEQAALILGERSTLASCLARIGEQFAVRPARCIAPQPLAAGMASFRSTLGQRVETLLDENHQIRPISTRLRITFVILLISLTMAASTFAPRAFASAVAEETPASNSEKERPMKRQLATIGILAGLTVPTIADEDRPVKAQPQRLISAKKTADAIPEQAVGLGGVLIGRIVKKDVDGGSFVISVDAVPRVWKNNKARKPKSLVGRNVAVDGLTGKWLDVLLVAKEGETVEVAARHHGGNKVTFPGEMFRKVAPYKPENYPELPDGFRGFQGAVTATVVRKDPRMFELVIEVDRVTDTWKNNQAKKAKEIEDHQAMLVGFWRRKEIYNDLKVGDRIEVGLQHIGQYTDMLTVAEFVRKSEGTGDSPRPRVESAEPTGSGSGFPEGMHGFNGMLVGKLVSKDVEKGTFVVSVDAVPRVWRNSKARAPKSIVKRNVEVDGVFGKWLDVLLVVKKGETLEFEARHDGEARLTFPGELLRKVAPYKPDDYPTLPEQFRGFQGAVAATILKKDPETFELIVKVDRILETAKDSGAKQPDSITGKKMMLAGFWQRKDAYHGLKVGDRIEVGLKHIGRQSDHLSVNNFVRKVEKKVRSERSEVE